MSVNTQASAVNCTNNRAERHVAKMLSRAASAYLNGEQKRFHYHSSAYLNSYDARRVAVQEAYNALAYDRRPDATTLPDIAKCLNAWAGTNEAVRVNIKPKGNNGDYRLIMDFGIENRALQYLGLPLIRITANLHPHQYGAQGGTHAAISYVRDMLLQGYVFAEEFDIKDCYPSFDEKKVPGLLSIPKEVTQRTIISRYLNLVPGNLRDVFGPADANGQEPILLVDALAEARPGIPQGSALSSLITEALLAIPLKTLPVFGRVTGYMDNILLMAKSENDGVAISKALYCALKAHPAGPLRPKVTNFFGKPVDYIGHRFTRIGAHVKIEPTPDNEVEFRQMVSADFRTLKRADISESRRARTARNLKTYVRSWTAAFSLCDGMKERRDKLLCQIKSMA